MTRVIVHAGFHKTGTTSLQGFLEQNEHLLAPDVGIYLKDRLKPAHRLGGFFGARPDAFRRWLFRRGFRRFLNTVPDTPTIIISRENFSGTILGYRDFRLRPHHRYAPMAIPLAQEIIRGLQHRFGADVEIAFLYTTREGEGFLESTWRHVVRTRPMRQDYASFRAGFTSPPDLATEAQEIASAIAPVPVHIAPLEIYGSDRFGPARALLDLIDPPAEVEARLAPAPRSNRGPSTALTQTFLEMNRKRWRRRALHAAKRKMILKERQSSSK